VFLQASARLRRIVAQPDTPPGPRSHPPESRGGAQRAQRVEYRLPPLRRVPCSCAPARALPPASRARTRRLHRRIRHLQCRLSSHPLSGALRRRTTNSNGEDPDSTGAASNWLSSTGYSWSRSPPSVRSRISRMTWLLRPEAGQPEHRRRCPPWQTGRALLRSRHHRPG